MKEFLLGIGIAVLSVALGVGVYTIVVGAVMAVRAAPERVPCLCPHEMFL